MTEIERQMLHARRRWAKIQRNPPSWTHEFGNFGLFFLILDESIKAHGWDVFFGQYTDGSGNRRMWPAGQRPWHDWGIALWRQRPR